VLRVLECTNRPIIHEIKLEYAVDTAVNKKARQAGDQRRAH
jgi:hypothetical protein